MSCTPEAEMESRKAGIAAPAKLIPLRRWVPEAFNDDEPMTLKPGRYGVDPAPVSDEDGEPLTFWELLGFWVVVWAFCIVCGLALGFGVYFLKGLM